MIAVVICFQSVVSLLYRPVVCFAHLSDLRHEVLFNLLFGDAADGCIFGREANVGQIVEDREEGDLGELGDASDENEMLVLVVRLKYGEHFTVNARAFLMFGCSP